MRTLAVFLLLASTLSASVIDAIARVESGNNHAAVGDSGKAHGAWQMHRAAWDDAAKRLNVAWPFSDAHNPAKALAIATEHLRWLTAQFERRTGRTATPSDQYALWNLGVAGYATRSWDISKCPTITQRAVQKLNTYLRD